MQEDLYDPNADRTTIDYVKKIGYARTTYLHNFLLNSTMIKPEKIDSPTTLVRIETGQYFTVSALQYSAWKPNGADCIGYIITNIGTSNIDINQTIDVPFSPPCKAYLLRDGKLEWTTICEDESVELSFTIKPLDIVLLVFGDLRRVWWKPDLNFDSVVNILDVTMVAKAFGTKPGDEKWDPDVDLNKDGTINIIDISIVARDFGKTWTP
jgi:hypothetical protein